ncbi:MAG: nuclear transport factor 2 family protein [Pseudomonadota bacterium]
MTEAFDWQLFYKTRSTGKADDILAFFHDLAVVEFAGFGRQTVHFSMSAENERANLTSRLAHEFVEAFKWTDYRVISFVQSGNEIFARLFVEYTFTPHDKNARMELCHHIRLNDKRIVSITEFADTALLEQLMNPEETSLSEN